MSLESIKSWLDLSFHALLRSAPVYFTYKARQAEKEYSICLNNLDLAKTIAKSMEPIIAPNGEHGAEIRIPFGSQAGCQAFIDHYQNGDKNFASDIKKLIESPSALDDRCQPLLEKMNDADRNATIAVALLVSTYALLILGSMIAKLRRSEKNA